MQHLRHPAPAACRVSGRDAGGGVAGRGQVAGPEPAPPPTYQSTALFWSFPGSALDVSLSRRWLAAAVEQAWGAGDDADRVVLAYSEVATNAVVHGRGPVTVSARIRAGGVVCQVADCSSGTPQLRHADPDDVCGRGLDLVRMSVDGFRVDLDEIGKTVSFEVGRHAVRPAAAIMPDTPAGSARSPLRWSAPGPVEGLRKTGSEKTAAPERERGSGMRPESGFVQSSAVGSASEDGSTDGDRPGTRGGSPPDASADTPAGTG
jgi:anti-sigma regulatory factor (Ser/Thr protein kinase)